VTAEHRAWWSVVRGRKGAVLALVYSRYHEASGLVMVGLARVALAGSRASPRTEEDRRGV
jgi:hypothetical protein